jgi:hypothetical protein
MERKPTRRTRALTPILAAACCAALGTGCGSATTRTAGVSAPAQDAGHTPAPPSTPLSSHEKLIAEGAPLATKDGCSTCHMLSAGARLGPSFYNFAGHDVKLADGQAVLVDEAFVEHALEDPGSEPISGYNPRLMWRTLERLHVHLTHRQIEALAAFVEQIGPES